MCIHTARYIYIYICIYIYITRIRSFNYLDILKTIIFVRTVSKCLEKNPENMKVVHITNKHLS